MKDEAAMTTDRPMGIEVTRQDAISFLEGACRNWVRVPGLSAADIEDVRVELYRFLARHRQSSIASLTDAPDAVREALEEIRHIEPEELYGIPDRCTGDRPSFQTLDAAEVFRIIDAALTTPPAKDDAGRLREAARAVSEEAKRIAMTRRRRSIFDALDAALSPQSDEGEERHG